MSEAKRLLEHATPLPWEADDYELSGPDDFPVISTMWAQDADRDLILYAVNRLPAYEAAVEALERLYDNAERIFDQRPVRDWGETLVEARAALARLRESEAANV